MAERWGLEGPLRPPQDALQDSTRSLPSGHAARPLPAPPPHPDYVLKGGGWREGTTAGKRRGPAQLEQGPGSTQASVHHPTEGRRGEEER